MTNQQPKSPFGETEEEFLDLLSRMTTDLAPRQFALFKIRGNMEDAALIAWGAAHPDRTDLNFNNGTSHGRFGPIDQFQLFFGPHNGYQVVWASQPSTGPKLT